MERLDNPVWHALTGPHARFAEGEGPARRYRAGVGVFAAVPDEPGPEAWDALRTLVGAGGDALVFRPSVVAPPAGWEVTGRLDSLQMVATAPLGEPDPGLDALGPADVPEMLALVARTRPGPFGPRTVELGRYLGRREAAAPPGRDGARLVAMAGERLHLEGHTELSAVCTDAGARRQGLATRLVRAVAHGIEARGETPMLHLRADNQPARRVYERLGFVTRAAFPALVVRAPR